MAADLTASIVDANREATKYATSDPVYAELMATYAELGELLTTCTDPQELEQGSEDLVTRLVELGKAYDFVTEQAMASWRVRYMSVEGVGRDLVQGRRHAA